MARKPPGQLSAAYAKRLASYERRHPGATRQAARGKPAKEHVIRAERARAAGKLTEPERATVRRWLAGNEDRKVDIGITIEDILASPYAVQQQFYRAAATTEQMRAAYKRKSFAGIGAGGLAELAEIFGLDERVFWYH